MKAKKKGIAILLSMCMFMGAFACFTAPAIAAPTPGDDETFTVTFDTGGGSLVAPVTVEDGAPVAKPTDPTRFGYSFVEWRTGSGAAYDFELPVIADLALIAAWQALPGNPVTLTLDPDVTHQVIEGFGFFGGMRNWSTANASQFYSSAWIDEILLDLGITMWRNEVYSFVPPDTGHATYDRNLYGVQDTNWDIQKPMVKALNDRAKELDIPLKIILTAWSPPPQWKSNQHSKSISGGNGDLETLIAIGGHTGYLLPEHYEDYGQWWVDILDMYKAEGVDVYGISMQNEPIFPQTFSSHYIIPIQYIALLKVVAPIIKAAYPDVVIFGAEHLLEHEQRGWNPYHPSIMADAAARESLGAFAVHGYADGEEATDISLHKEFWESEKATTAPSGNPRWMTETSGYGNNWLNRQSSGHPTITLAMAIQSALLYGDVSAWVFWQGYVSSANPNQYELTSQSLGRNSKKYAASQHFYKYIRPGAVRIGSQLTGAAESDLLITAFTHHDDQSLVITLVNSSTNNQVLSIAGISALDYDVYVTNATDNFAYKGRVAGSIYIPERSAVTLVADAGGKGVIPEQYTVTFDNEGVKTSSLVDAGTTVAQPAAPARAGFIFNGWRIGSADRGVMYNFGKPVLSNLTIYASWIAENMVLEDVAIIDAVQVGGASDKSDSTGIRITFDKEVAGLTADDITITNGPTEFWGSSPLNTGGITGAVVKGDVLTGAGATYTIQLSSVPRAGIVTVGVNNFGKFNVTGNTMRTVEVIKDTRIPALVSITGPASVVSGSGATASYTISAAQMPPTSGIELEFEVDGTFLSSKEFNALGGFSIVDAGNYSTPVYWRNVGDKWIGKATLVDLGMAGISGNEDIIELVFNAAEGMLGVTDVKLNYVIMSHAGVSLRVQIADGAVSTIFEKYYSPYDLNKDDVIDLNDLTYALQYLLVELGDPEWDDAKAIDYNNNNRIDIDDLILILANYTIPYYS